MRRSQTRVDPLAELQTAGAGPSRSPMGTDSLLDTHFDDDMPVYMDKKQRRVSPLTTHSPVIASPSPRSPLQESRQVNRIPYPSPVSNSPTLRSSSAFPPPFGDRSYQRFLADTLAQRSTISPLDTLKKAADYVNNMSFGATIHSPLSPGSLTIDGRSTSPVSSTSSGLTFDDFAAIAAESKRSPVLGGKRVLEAVDDDLPAPSDDNSREAAAILMTVADDHDSHAPRRTQRTSRPTGKAASPAPKTFRSEGKRAKTAATPSAKVSGEPAPKKVKKPSLRLKDPVEGAIDGVGMAPQGVTYKAMIVTTIEEHGRPVRVSEIFAAWKRKWPFYANMTEELHLVSVDNSIRHTLSMPQSKSLFQRHPDATYPDLLAAEKAMGIKNNGGWWSIIPGRTIENHSKLAAQEREAKVSKEQK